MLVCLKTDYVLTYLFLTLLGFVSELRFSSCLIYSVGTDVSHIWKFDIKSYIMPDVIKVLALKDRLLKCCHRLHFDSIFGC